jgi:hypothetical protein
MRRIPPPLHLFTSTPRFKLTGEFYGLDPPTANLELLARFFERYPDYADKAFLSVKVSIPRFGACTRFHAQNGHSVAHHTVHMVTCMFPHQLLKWLLIHGLQRGSTRTQG